LNLARLLDRRIGKPFEDPNPALHERKTMGTNIATAATSTALIPGAAEPAGGKEYTDER
jgi:hypothetical protein